jgi:hypothetical protein
MWGGNGNFGIYLSLLYNINITPDLRQNMAMGFYREEQDVLEDIIELVYHENP